jgi:hypothetical protein
MTACAAISSRRLSFAVRVDDVSISVKSLVKQLHHGNASKTIEWCSKDSNEAL